MTTKNVHCEQQQLSDQKAGLFKNHKIRVLTLVFSLCCLMSISAFAADGDPVTVSSILTSALPTITASVSGVWELMTSNPLCLFALGCAILGVGFRFIRRALRTSHRC